MAIALNWKALSGIESNWEGLLDPINVNLRWYLVHYGERVEAANEAFNAETKDSLFHREVFFLNTGLQNNKPFKYSVTNFLFATPQFDLGDSVAGENSFVGYVAVATDEGKFALGRRDILICWRGTDMESFVEKIKDMDIYPISASELFPNYEDEPKAHKGFLTLYTNKSDSAYIKTSARDQVLEAVRGLVDKYAELNEEVSITVVGYSLGAAIATLNATDIVYNGYNKPTGSSSAFPVTAFTYATPQVGDGNFFKLFNELNQNKDLHILRIRNAKDIVPVLVRDFANFFNINYYDVGLELEIDTQNSTDTRTQNIGISHNLELYLYGIAYYQGKGKALSKAIDFDLAVLNKSLDLLKDEYNVPPNWWPSIVNPETPNLMVQQDSGVWVPTDANNGTK